MRKKLTCIMGAMVLGWLHVPARAQAPQFPNTTPLPPPQPLSRPAESPPPALNDITPPSFNALTPPPFKGLTPPPTVGGINHGVFPDIIARGGGADACCNGDRQRSSWSGTWSAGAGGGYLVPFFGSNPAYFTNAAGRNTQQD